MRDFERISPFLDALAHAWRRDPDLRFGQLVIDLSTLTTNSDVWTLEEPEWTKAIQKFEERFNE